MAPIPSKIRPALVPLTLIVVAAAGVGGAAGGRASPRRPPPTSPATASGIRWPVNRQILCIPGPFPVPDLIRFDRKRSIKLEPLCSFRHRIEVRSRVPLPAGYRLVHHGVDGGDSWGIRHAVATWATTVATSCRRDSGLTG